MLGRTRSSGRWWITGWLFLLVLSTVLETSAAGSHQLTILMTSGSSGRLMDEEADASIAVLAATVRNLAHDARSQGRSVLVLDGGRTLLPYAESRFDRGASMIAALSTMGCQAFLPAPIDLSVGPESLSQLSQKSSFPILMPLVSSDDLGAGTTILEMPDGPSVLLANLVDSNLLGDLTAAGYETATPATAASLKGIGNDTLRVAVVHSGGRGSSMTTRHLSWGVIEDPNGLDLVLDPDFGQEVVLRRQTEDGPVWLAGRPETKSVPWTVAVIELDLIRKNGDWEATDVNQRIVGAQMDAAVNPQLEAQVRESFKRFRISLAQQFSPRAPRNREELTGFVLEAMRERADAEIAVLNRGGLRPVDSQHFPGKSLTREAVIRLLSVDQILVAGEISGSTLQKLVAESVDQQGADDQPSNRSLLFSGVSFEVVDGKPTSVRVNGRPVYADDPYSVVSTQFLAAGGDGYTHLGALEGQKLRNEMGGALELREAVVIPRLVEAEKPFVDLEKEPLWRYSVDRIRLAFDAVSTSHDDSYADASDSRARAQDSGSLLLDARLWVDREQPSWTWENDLRARFGLIDTEGNEPNELDDDLQVESAALFTKWELFGGAHPFANLKLDSEFRSNEDSRGERLPRQFEQTLGAGISWSFKHWPRLRFAAVGRHYSSIDRSAEVGATAEAWYEWKASGRRPSFEARLMLEHLSGSKAQVQRADLDLRLNWALSNRLLFTPGINYYVYDDSARKGAARYGRLTLGLTYSWSDKHQTR